MILNYQVIDLNQSQTSVVTVSAVQLMEDYQGCNIPTQISSNTNLKNQRHSLQSIKSLSNKKKRIDITVPYDDDVESNIDFIDLDTEDEYASSVYTRRSISPTSR